MDQEDRLRRIEEQLIKLMEMVADKTELKDTIVTVDTQKIKDDTYVWCTLIQSPGKKALPQTGFSQGKKLKAEMIAAWAGIQTVIHSPEYSGAIHVFSNSSLGLALTSGESMIFTDQDLTDRYNKLLELMRDKRSNETVSEHQRTHHLGKCAEILEELRENIEKEKECSQSAESELSQKTTK